MQPGETARLHVGEAQMLGQRYQLTAIEDDQLQVIVNGGGNRAAVEQALAPVLAARARVHDLDTQIEGKQKDIDRRTEDQKRLHNNLAGLKDSPEERALARRYAGEMNTDEDQLQWLKKDQGDLEAQRKQAQQTLDETIRNLSIDLDV
jgi:predicted  nucleic acid-binding Zn-ribbon protein